MISCYNPLARGDYVIIAWSLNFNMNASRFVNVTEEVVNLLLDNSITKRTKDAIKFGITLLKRSI